MERLIFRLQEEGPLLWHGLTMYQLGALLHDLIMKKLLFADVLRQHRGDPWPLAYAIAMQVPTVESEEVAQDLVLLARRALDKDPKRRLAAVGWADFLGSPPVA